MPTTSAAVVLEDPAMSGSDGGGGGGGVTGLIFMNAPISRRPPVAVMPVREGVPATLDSSALSICDAVALGCAEA